MRKLARIATGVFQVRGNQGKEYNGSKISKGELIKVTVGIVE
jgi:hypothetical protein